MVLGLLNQLQIFSQLYLIELLGLLTGLGLLKLWHLIYPRPKAFDRVWHAGLLHKRKYYGISDLNLALLLLFSVIDGFEWFRMEGLHKNVQLMQ